MTKIITIIIIVSTVWSVISGIIEKHKKDKLTKPGNVGLKKAQTQVQSPRESLSEIFEARINALRKRPTKKTPVSTEVLVALDPIQRDQTRAGSLIKPLHKQDCPLPTTKDRKRRQTRAMAVSKLLKTPHSVRTAIILTEVLSKPISQR
jgi:hypothetical protein